MLEIVGNFTTVFNVGYSRYTYLGKGKSKPVSKFQLKLNYTATY